MKNSAGRHLEALPRREVLETLAHHYHHLQNEHKRAHPGSGIRRRIEGRQLEVRQQFERVLAEWVPEPEAQRAWHDHLRNRAPVPPGPPAIRPLVFQGVSDAGSVAEIRGKKGEELGVEVDGSLVERIPYESAFAATQPPVTFRLNHSAFVETFTASADALEALATFLAEGESPPWEYVEALLGDGLIDTNAALTPRGRRALASREE
jgi:hypothetical protein